MCIVSFLLAPEQHRMDFVLAAELRNLQVHARAMSRHELTAMSRHELTATVLMFVLGTCAQGWLMATILRRFSQGVETMQKQLASFTVAGAQCYCCFVNHRTPDGDIPCDRQVLQKCIRHWFGSVEEFEKVVQTRVRDAARLNT